MKRAVVVGLTLACVCLVFALSGPSAQRIAPQPSAPATRPSQVEVTNFPAVQPVTGTVAVDNLPAVQSVAGSVTVGNLPMDADGNLKVAAVVVAPRAIRFVRFTQKTFDTSPGSVALSNACNDEMPGTRACLQEEILTSIPPAPLGWDWVYLSTTGVGQNCMSSSGFLSSCNGLTLPVACCGY